ncbi:MAG: RtcB family protein [Clostridia bacterium]|nr:RtcB family protein [Clostridia bacterium]
MIEIRGKNNMALCYTDALEESARQQIQDLCDLEMFSASRIRIMPDVHAGTGCTIGTTMTLTDRVVPSLVGVDIGCGMETVQLKEKEIDFDQLDRVIRTRVPSGDQIREDPHPLAEELQLEDLRCARAANLDRARLSIGTLGGGNHFIEVDRDENGNLYLVIHSGSRYLGVQTASYYQHLGWKTMNTVSKKAIRELIDRYRSEGREREIEEGLKNLRQESSSSCEVPEKYAYVEGEHLESYLHDMHLVQQYAALNRQAMVREILEGMHLTEVDRFTTVHNYIDVQSGILRKGAVSAQKGERLLIPINMRDGALICTGRGNEEWNCSAPHGAGRIMSRGTAKSSLTVEAFRHGMQGIYTTCVSEETLDESPMAYKGLEEILHQIGPTAEVAKRIRPVYNFKAGN